MNKLHEITNRLLGVTDFSEAMNEILIAAIDLSAADLGDIQLVAPENDLNVVAQHGFEPMVLQRSLDSAESEETPFLAWRRVAVSSRRHHGQSPGSTSSRGLRIRRAIGSRDACAMLCAFETLLHS